MPAGRGQILVVSPFAQFARINPASGINLRQAGAFGLAEDGSGLLHAAHGDAQIRVGHQGFRHQGVELRITERLPPFGADGRATLPCFREDVSLGQRRPDVIRTKSAATEEDGG